MLSNLKLGFGAFLVVVGSSVFAIRLQHAGPYGFPSWGNSLAALLALGLGALFVGFARGVGEQQRLLTVAALIAAAPVLFFALYATLAELEEVVVLYASDRAGNPTALRLWIVDEEGEEWASGTAVVLRLDQCS